LQVVFGQLIVNEDGLTGRIEADKAGWHGTSDLQVCSYLPTQNLCLPVSKARVSDRKSQDGGGRSLCRGLGEVQKDTAG
jgi:hypothetical protein